MRIALTWLVVLQMAMASAIVAWERSNDQGFAARASLSSDHIALTDTLTLTLTLTHPPGYAVDPNLLAKNLLTYGETTNTAFKLKGVKAPPLDGKTTIVFTLEPLEPGKQLLGFWEIPFKPSVADKPPVTLISDVLRVDVTGTNPSLPLAVADVLPLENRPLLALDPENELELAEQAQEQPSHNRQLFLDRSFPWHYFVLFPLAVVIVIGSLRLLVRLYLALISRKHVPTPNQIAQKRLKALSRSGLLKTGKFDGFYVQLTQILRDYISARYGISAPEMTTEEFMQVMSSHPVVDEANRHALQNLLAYADGVKFAQQPATTEQCKQALSYAKHFVDAQKPR